MRHVIPVALLLLAALAATAGDIPVAPRQTGPSAEPNLNPLIVGDGNELVVVWTTLSVPRFARMRESGEVLLSGELSHAGYVFEAVAGPGGSVLAALIALDGVHVAAISRNGDVHISDVVAESFSSMAWNGSALLIVTQTGETIFTDGTGRILDRGPELSVPITGLTSAARRGNGFLVAWVDRSTVTAITLTPAGEVSREQIIPDRPVDRVSAGCNTAGSCLLVFRERDTLSGQILGESAGTPFPISNELLGDLVPPVWDGQRFLLTWTDPAGIHVSAAALSATVTPVATIPAGGLHREGPAVAHANGRPVVVWEEAPFCTFAGSQIVARPLRTGDDVRLTHGLSEQTDPVVAAGTATALVVWNERSGASRIRARLFPFTAPAFDVSPSPYASTPVVGTDGNGYLVAWLDALPEEGCRNALRISVAGSGTVFTLARDVDPITRPQITWNGSEYVVLWEQYDPAELFAARVDRSGQPLDPHGVPLTPSERNPDSYTSIDHEPAGLAWTGNGYLLVWRRSRTTYIPFYPDPPPQYEVRATVLGPRLIPAGPPRPVAPFWNAAAAAKGNDIVALWQAPGTLHAVRLSPDGSVLATRDLGVDSIPVQIVATRTGFAVLSHGEILFLGDDLSLIGRRATPAPLTSIAATSGGLVEVYVKSGEVFFSPPLPPRRRSVR